MFNTLETKPLDARTLEDIRNLVADDMKAVDQLILKSLRSDVALIGQLGHYIINSGGKRLRPLLVLLASRACGISNDKHIHIAAIIEFIHTATLLHDDVVDASDMRRGHETANAIWGNEASVLVGDFLYSRAFEMMVDIGEMRVMEILSHATNTIAEGEVLQLMNCNDPDTDEQRYMEVIYRKTAKLFEAGTQLAAVMANAGSEIETALSDYGRYLGSAFQLIDDALDYNSSSAEIGKNIGDDLAEGKPTLPVIYAMVKGDPDQVALVRNAIEQGSLEQIEAVKQIIESTEAIAYTAQQARREAERAQRCLTSLPTSPYTEALATLAVFSVQRSF